MMEKYVEALSHVAIKTPIELTDAPLVPQAPLGDTIRGVPARHSSDEEQGDGKGGWTSREATKNTA